MKFPIWNTDAWKVGLTTNTGVTKTDGQLTSLSNSTSTSSFLNFLISDFNHLFKRKAHLHHYTRIDGCELEHFKEALINVNEVSHCYSDLARTWQEKIEIDDLLPIF